MSGTADGLLTEAKRLGWASAALVLSYLLTGYLWFALTIGFFEKGLFLVAGVCCLVLSGVAAVLLVSVDRLVGRVLLIMSGFLLLYWTSGIVSLWWKR